MMRGVGKRAKRHRAAALQPAGFVKGIDAISGRSWPLPTALVSSRRARNPGAQSVRETTLEEARDEDQGVEIRTSSNSAIVLGP
jgi:hypothetical protein